MMNGFIKIVLAVVTLSMVSCMACNEQRANKVYDGETVKLAKKVKLNNSDDSPTYDIEFDCRFAKPGKIGDKINRQIIERLFQMEQTSAKKAVDSFANQLTEIFKRDCKMFYEADLRSEIEIDKSLYNYRYRLESKATEGDKYVTFEFTETRYEGGVDDVAIRYVINFDKKSGSVVRIDDLIKPHYERRLEELLLNKLMEQTDCRNKEELNKKGYLLSKDMYVPENFLFEQDKIVFLFNKNEIAPSELDIIEIILTNEEMAEILKQE